MFLAGHINGQKNAVQPAKHETKKVNLHPSQYASYPGQENNTGSFNS